MPILPGAEAFAFAGGRTGVLLCHGFTGTPQSMRPWGDHLRDAGYTVSCPRLPGHGTRWQDMKATRWPDWYGEVDRAFGDLQSRCDRCFVMGLSMGGTLALRLAEHHQRAVAGLVLVNPSLASTNRALALLPVLQFVIPSLKGVAGDIKKPGVREVAYDRMPLRAARSLGRLWALTRHDLHRVVSPVLVFSSAQDHVVEPVNRQLLLAGLTGAEVTERALPDSYHVATLDNDAELVFRASVEFVEAHAHSATGG